MWLFKYGMPILGFLGFGHAVYEIFTGKIDPEKMGSSQPILKMFGVANLFMAVSWVVVFFGLLAGAAWPRSLAIFITGMYFFDYVVSLPQYKKIGDNFFKYWAGAALVLAVVYCLWL